MSTALFSREIAAGYNPEKLGKMRCLVIGCGALGQNTAQDLALSQVGESKLVDMDYFEDHNAPRSPFYEKGASKAESVAYNIRQMISWSDKPKISYAHAYVQELGDQPFREATHIISCVDKNGERGRGYLASIARKFNKPFIEGGFGANHINMTILTNKDHHSACWDCGRTEHHEAEFNCTAKAKMALEQGFAPAIQTAASCLGALMAQATIKLAHGDCELADKKCFGNIDNLKMAIMDLKRDPECANHEIEKKPEIECKVSKESPCRALFEQLGSLLKNPRIELPARFVKIAPCVNCRVPLEIGQPIWRLPHYLLCQSCGGEWTPTIETTLPVEIYSSLTIEDEILHLSLGKLGIIPNSILYVWDKELLIPIEIKDSSNTDPFTHLF